MRGQNVFVDGGTNLGIGLVPPRCGFHNHNRGKSCTHRGQEGLGNSQSRGLPDRNRARRLQKQAMLNQVAAFATPRPSHPYTEPASLLPPTDVGRDEHVPDCAADPRADRWR